MLLCISMVCSLFRRFHCMVKPQFVHSPPFLFGITNKPVINIRLQVFVWTSVTISFFFLSIYFREREQAEEQRESERQSRKQTPH